MLSNRVTSMKESATLAMAQKGRELAASGVDVISMSLGEPDFAAPDFLKEAAKAAIDKGYNTYSPVPGYQDLKEAICHKLKRDNNLNYQPNQIVVSTGAKQSVANLIFALCDEGDEIILPAPYWVSYNDIAKFVGAKSVTIPTTIKTDFKITPEQLDKAITKKSKLFLFSNPCNPSGTLYNESELRALAKVFEKHPHVQIASDEIYEYITFDEKYFSIGEVESIKNRVTTINGLSKAFAVTGWRLGYMAAPLEIANGCAKIQSQFTSGATSITQRAAITALNAGKESVEYMRVAFQKRRDFFIAQIEEFLPEVKVNRPQGAFYLFPDISAYFGRGGIKDSNDLAIYLLAEAHVASTPGEPFGCPENIRFSYALNESKIEEAVKRMKAALDKL